MGKIQDIEELVGKCETIIMGGYKDTAKELVEHIISVYSKDISNYRTGLDMYKARAIANDLKIEIDYIGDLKKIKAKLINYKYELESRFGNS